MSPLNGQNRKLADFRRSLSLLLSVLLNLITVSCQLNIRGFRGDDVLLPCIYRELDRLGDKPLFWVDKDDSILLEIRGKKENAASQNRKYSGRVESFPQLYGKGNASLVLRNVQPPDSGPFDCQIPSEDFQQRVVLTVSDERVGVAATPPAATPPPQPAGGVTTVTQGASRLVLISLILPFVFSWFVPV